MLPLVYLITTAIALYCGVSWLLPRCLAWLCQRKYKLDVDIGRIGMGLWYFTLRDVKLSKGHVSVQIDEIGFQSSFFSSEVAKLLSLVIKDVRIDVNASSRTVNSATSVFSNDREISFHNQKIPPAIITFIQFMAIHVYNISVMFLRVESPEWLVHASAKQAHLDGSIIHNARTLLVNASVGSITAKLLKHAGKNDPQTCLAELSFGISLEATVIAQGPMSVEKLYLGMTNPAAVIQEAIYDFAQRTRLETNELEPNLPTQTQPSKLFYNLLPIIPKNFNLNVENSVLNGMRDDNKIDFSATSKSIIINTQVNQATGLKPIKSRDFKLPQIFISCQMEYFDVKCNKINVIEMTKLGIDGTFEENLINIFIKLSQSTLCYEHIFMKTWVVNNFLKTKDVKNISKKPILIRSKSSWFESFCELYQFSNLHVELSNVCVWFHLPEDPNIFSIGFQKMDFTLEKTQDTRNNLYDSPIGKLLFGKKHWSFDLQILSFWCKFDEKLLNSDEQKIKKYHKWGTPLFISLVLFKVRSQSSNDIKVSGSFDIFRTEWSPKLAKMILQCIKCINEYKVGSTGNNIDSKKSNIGKLITNFSFTNANMYCLAEDDVCLMMRIDKLRIDDDCDKKNYQLEGAKLMPLKPSEVAHHSCLRSSDIKLASADVNSIRVHFNQTTRDLIVKVFSEVNFEWSPNLHLKALQLLSQLKTFLNQIKPNKNVTKTPVEPLKWGVKIDKDTKLKIITSKTHNVTLKASELAIGQTDVYAGVESNLLKINVDNVEIFKFHQFKCCRQNDDPDVAIERNKNDGFALPVNRVWMTTIDSFKAVFPYNHNYAEAVQGELISTWKWLKLNHRKNPEPFTAAVPLPPLPADLHIKIKEFLFEMSDDPFEVRLRDNYVLLEDEYKESVKRKAKLDEKVEEICLTRLLHHDAIEELYQNLTKKNAEIYIKRSNQMKLQSPTRTRLFAWSISHVELIALADPTLHGKSNVTNIMTEIDPLSPWPEEGLEFSTLWCRSIFASFKEWEFQLRDFPQPLMLIREMQIFGRLVGAEQIATKRARRTVTLDLGEPFGTATIERSMTSLKFYHDFYCEIEHFRYAFGPCWEPVIAQCNISFDKIIPSSRDPSPALPWWDKMRLLFHGRLTMFTKQLTCLLHASLDPYNTTEEMELTWSTVAIDWTNGKFVFRGDFNVFVRTASKYDDCRLLQLPQLKFTLKLTWVCLYDPNDHHAVMPCAPDKLPEYSSNQVHDSFRAFRSQNLNVAISLETKSGSSEFDYPSALLYGSTLRWFENLKFILSGATRPTRRGALFNHTKLRKKQLSRHYRRVRLLIGVHRFQVFYWMSFAMQRGFELLGGRVSFGSEYILNISKIDDGLIHRPRAEWSVSYMNCDLNDAEIWLKSALQVAGQEVDTELLRQPVEKCYCLSVVKVTYVRETVVNRRTTGVVAPDTPTHRLVVYDLKGAWTKSNRDVAFVLFDTFIKSKQLKKNLSTEALKGFRGENNSKPRAAKQPGADGHVTPKPNESLLTSPPTIVLTGGAVSPSTASGVATAASMLQQLIAEVDSKPVVFSDDLSVQTTGQRLQGLQACQEDDVLYKNWLISLINSQVLLKGCETKGYVILSAAKAEILQKIHHPVWKDRTLVSKTTWVGSLDCMQYYATVAAAESQTVDENIVWLTVDNIQEKESVQSDPSPDMLLLMSCGQSVGGVVTKTVGASSSDGNTTSPVQLQRIVSRCKCEFFYAGYGETSIDPSTVEQVPPLLIDEVGPWATKEPAVDAFTLMHHDLDVCTNSVQYAMILDIVNHLLLYVEPQRKELSERLQRMRFQLALHSTEDQRRPIQSLQNKVRSQVSKLRRLERETYLVEKTISKNGETVDLREELKLLMFDVAACKEQLAAFSEELDLMLSCYKETQISANQKLNTMKGDKPVTIVRANEIVFKHAKWRLTDADGQLGIADLTLSNFLYTKNSKNDDSVEHLLELGYIYMINLLPHQIYEDVLKPTEIQSNMPVDRKTAVRVFCREKAPVGGISIMEHLEINVVPLTIGLTKKFYNTMITFCFPGRDPDTIEGDDEVEPTEKGTKKVKSSSKKGKDTNFYVKIEQKDDVEKMKERAEKNKIFIYIKIPEVPVKVSYKGNKEKNLEDVRDFRIVIPTLEYHNVTWTWLDLLLALKTDSRRVILPQAIKQKLNIKGRRNVPEESTTPQEEDKARILFGSRVAQPGNSSKVPKKGSILKFPR